MAALLRRRGRIGVIELFGVIGPVVQSAVYYQLLDRLERDSRIRAVVLDIDSPGGAVTASESLSAKVARLQRKKPVVAFIRGAGTSGGLHGRMRCNQGGGAARCHRGLYRRHLHAARRRRPPGVPGRERFGE